MNKLINWIKEKPALNISEIANEVKEIRGKCTRGYLNNVLKGTEIPKDFSFWFDLAKVLCNYGLEIDGRKFHHYKDNEGTLFSYYLEKTEDGFKTESLDKGDHFEYLFKGYQNFYDAFDFYQFIQND